MCGGIAVVVDIGLRLLFDGNVRRSIAGGSFVWFHRVLKLDDCERNRDHSPGAAPASRRFPRRHTVTQGVTTPLPPAALPRELQPSPDLSRGRSVDGEGQDTKSQKTLVRITPHLI